MISVMDILSEEPIQYSNIKSSVEVDEKVEQSYKVEDGDLVFVRSSEVVSEVGWAKAYTENEYALFSGFSIRGKKKCEFDNFFTELSLNSKGRIQIESKAGGSTRFNVNRSILSSIAMYQPNESEQAAIGNFFRILDNTIALHQRKLDGLKELKKGYLQQMFPQAGEHVPRLRFAGFEGDWEQQRAKEVFSPLSIKGRKELPVLSVTQDKGVVYRDDLDIDIKFNRSSLAGYKVISPGNFVISLRSFQGGFELSDKLGISSPAYTIFKEQFPEEHDKAFWKYAFKRRRFIDLLKTVTFGIRDGKSISFKEFGDLKLYFPIVEEQAVIGNFFRELDSQITAQAKKIEQLKQLKQAYLQKMFI